MSFFSPEIGIRFFDEIELKCSACDYGATRSDVDLETKEALVRTTPHHELAEEHRLLTRTKEFFGRFPDSRHPLIVRLMFLHDPPEPRPDSTFDTALASDTELRDFLKDNMCYLPARIEFCADRCREYDHYTRRADVACPNCDGYLILPREFYFRVGCYIDSLEDDPDP